MAKVTTTRCISANPIRNNSATVIFGTVRTGAVTKAMGRTTVGYRDNFGGLKVTPPGLHENALNFTQKALSSGNFAKMLPRKYVIRKVTTELAGVSKTALYMTPAIRWNKSISYKEFTITEQNMRRGDLNITWDYQTGRPTTTPGFTQDNFGNDNAARPTRLIPGELVYMHGHRSGPRLADYAARQQF